MLCAGVRLAADRRGKLTLPAQDAAALADELGLWSVAALRLRRCGRCGRPFLMWWSAETCGDCRAAAAAERRREAMARRRAEERAQRVLPATCAVCGAAIEARRRTRKYCGNACAQRAVRARRG